MMLQIEYYIVNKPSIFDSADIEVFSPFSLPDIVYTEGTSSLLSLFLFPCKIVSKNKFFIVNKVISHNFTI